MKNLLKGSLLVGVGVAIGYLVSKKVKETKKEELAETIEETMETVTEIAKKVVKVAAIGTGVIFITKLGTKMFIHEAELRRLTDVTQSMYLAQLDMAKHSGYISVDEFKDILTTMKQIKDCGLTDRATEMLNELLEGVK